MKNYQNHIVINPNIRFGQATIYGTRISVSDILGWLANGMSYEEILLDYPELTIDLIRSALAYAADKEHKTRIAS